MCRIMCRRKRYGGHENNGDHRPAAVRRLRYIWLDIAFLCVFLILVLMKKKYMTVLVGLVMGVVYMPPKPKFTKEKSCRPHW